MKSEKSASKIEEDDERGVLTRQDAKFLAKRLFEKLDEERAGFLTQDQLSAWRKNALENVNLNDVFTLESGEIFFQALDYDGNARVTLQDFENVFFRYLCNVKI